MIMARYQFESIEPKLCSGMLLDFVAWLVQEPESQRAQPPQVLPDGKRAVVFSNNREIFSRKGVTYLPVYYCMFLQREQLKRAVILPELESV